MRKIIGSLIIASLGFGSITATAGHNKTLDEHFNCKDNFALAQDLDLKTAERYFGSAQYSVSSKRCVKRTAIAIKKFREQSPENNTWSLLSSEADMRAMVGDKNVAISLFKQAIAKLDRPLKDDDMGYTYPIHARLAFVERDYDKLIALRTLLKNLPVPDYYTAALPKLREISPDVDHSFPVSLFLIDEYIECYDRKYYDAVTSCSGYSLFFI